MNRFLNGMIAWLVVVLAVLLARAATQDRRAAGKPARTEGGTLRPGEERPVMRPRTLAPSRAEAQPALADQVRDRAWPPQRTVDTIIVHHSASVRGDATAIHQWHRERGWNGIGYHYVIANGVSHGGHACSDGEIQAGREEHVAGAHARNRNQSSLGVCLIGADTFTAAQLRSLRGLLVELCRRHGITPSATTIQRHHEQCPGAGLDLDAIIASVARQVGHR